MSINAQCITSTAVTESTDPRSYGEAADHSQEPHAANAADAEAMLHEPCHSVQYTQRIDGTGQLPSPDVTEGMYYGVVGDVMRAACDNTEVHPAAAGLAYMCFCGVALGRESYVQIGNASHHPRLYGVHVGRSGIGGKGMALELTRLIREQAEAIGGMPERLATGHMHDGGLSSREGLVFALRDASDTVNDDGNPSDPGVKDKRMFIVEEEFAEVLDQAKREGNTLSAALRSAWDGGDIAPLTKTSRISVTRPHIGIHACITPSDLARSMRAHDLKNGFANRFLYVWAERQGIVPFPQATPATSIRQFAERLNSAIAHASCAGAIAVSSGASGVFQQFYLKHRQELNVPNQIRGLLERHPPYAWRIALMFALLDCRRVISLEDMRASLAWLDYCRESVVRIFSSAELEERAEKAAELATRVITEIRKSGGTMRREPLRNALGKPAASLLDQAIELAELAGQIHITSTKRPGGGRPTRAYRLITPRDSRSLRG